MADKSEDLPDTVLRRGKADNGSAPKPTVVVPGRRCVPPRLLPRAIGPSPCRSGTRGHCYIATQTRQAWGLPQGHTSEAGCPGHDTDDQESHGYGDNQTENA
jgi:hypothetical protein